MLNPNVLLVEQVKIIQALGPVAPSSSTPDFVSLKNANRCTVIINAKNAAAGAVGSAISITQATAVNNAGGKTLAFTKAYSALNTGPSGNTDVLTEFAVSSNTFTTDNATASADNLYVIEINETDLDVANNFDCLRVNTGNVTNVTVAVTYILWPQKYGKTSLPSAIAD